MGTNTAMTEGSKPMREDKKKLAREARRQRQQRQTLLRWGGLGLLGLLIVGALVWFITHPAAAQVGDEVTVTSRAHVPEGSDPGPYATNPPVGGSHYPVTYKAGFYQESDLASLPQKYEGYLVHNLEHGYVVFWYNCAAQGAGNCDQLKQTIRQVMGEFNNEKLIAFPWASDKEPLVMTSWGRIMRFNQIDVDKMRQFVKGNRYQAPEPDAQ